jgi:hypothetical protein
MTEHHIARRLAALGERLKRLRIKQQQLREAHDALAALRRLVETAPQAVTQWRSPAVTT